jgi:SAM-dependent methyltransferase
MAATMERLNFDERSPSDAVEVAIHLTRYLLARQYCAGKRVLDVACGEGYGAYLLRERWGAREVHGVDCSEDAIAAAQGRFSGEGIVYHCRAAEELAGYLADASFDVIVSLETFEHLQDPAPVLETFKRLLRPDGVVIVTCPNDYWYYPRDDERNPFHVRKYTFAEFQSLCEGALGPASQYLLGTPVAGYVNIARGDGHLTPAGSLLRGLLDARTVADGMLVPSDGPINEYACNYFTGIWGGAGADVATTATMLPRTLSDSEATQRALQVQNLRDEVIALRTRLCDLDPEGMASLPSAAVANMEAHTQRRAAERRARHAELRLAALRVEGEFTQARLAEVRQRAAEAERTRDDAVAEATALRQQMQESADRIRHLEAENTYKAQVIEDWRVYIERVEHDLGQSQAQLRRTAGFQVRRVGRAMKRWLGLRPAQPPANNSSESD